jgi:hypothetical protein
LISRIISVTQPEEIKRREEKKADYLYISYPFFFGAGVCVCATHIKSSFWCWLRNAFCADAVGHRDAADDIISLRRRGAMIAPNHAENEADKDKLHIAHTARGVEMLCAPLVLCAMGDTRLIVIGLILMLIK